MREQILVSGVCNWDSESEDVATILFVIEGGRDRNCVCYFELVDVVFVFEGIVCTYV
jgi:hypothetical protein